MRFIEWTEKENGCWICTSHRRGSEGYFHVVRDHKRIHIHRLFYQECFGAIPVGMVIRHKCDNNSCINPEHLELGTYKENAHDKKRNGTWQAGEKHHHKLNWNIVFEIRKQYRKGETEKLASKYGVDKSTILQIVERKTWTQDHFGRVV